MVQILFLLLMAMHASSTKSIIPGNQVERMSFNAMPEELLKKWMMDLSFNESLAFALAIRPSDAINPLKSNTLNPLTYHDPELDDNFAFWRLLKANHRDRNFHFIKLLQNPKIKNKADIQRMIFKEAAKLEDYGIIDMLLLNGLKVISPLFTHLILNKKLSVVKELVYRNFIPDYLVLKDAAANNDMHAVKYLLSLDYSWPDLAFIDRYVLAMPTTSAETKEIKKMINDARKEAYRKWKKQKNLQQ